MKRFFGKLLIAATVLFCTFTPLFAQDTLIDPVLTTPSTVSQNETSEEMSFPHEQAVAPKMLEESHSIYVSETESSKMEVRSTRFGGAGLSNGGFLAFTSIVLLAAGLLACLITLFNSHRRNQKN